MIDNHHLAYAGVLLVFLAGAAIIAMASLLFLATGALAAVAVRIIKHLAHGRVPDRARKGRKAVERPLPMEEALRQSLPRQDGPCRNDPRTARKTRFRSGRRPEASEPARTGPAQRYGPGTVRPRLRPPA